MRKTKAVTIAHLQALLRGNYGRYYMALSRGDEKKAEMFLRRMDKYAQQLAWLTGWHNSCIK